jgi:hypothetical protein
MSVFAKVFAKIFRENENVCKSFRVKKKVTTKILHFNFNFSACLWQLSHLF